MDETRPEHGVRNDAAFLETTSAIAGVIPLIAEELRVEKRVVETGRVRIVKTVNAQEVTVDELLLREQVDIQRVPIGRIVEGNLPAIREEGDTLIVPVLEEVLVVEKRMFLKEELHVTRRREEFREPQQVTLRAEEVTIERANASELAASGHAVKGE